MEETEDMTAEEDTVEALTAETARKKKGKADDRHQVHRPRRVYGAYPEASPRGQHPLQPGIPAGVQSPV